MKINKQKFLIELSRLLTFMFDEDKETVIEMYSQLFDDYGDDQALSKELISPTRQAVIIARRYDASARAGEGGRPDFVLAIEEVISEVSSKRRAPVSAVSLDNNPPSYTAPVAEEEEPEEESEEGQSAELVPDVNNDSDDAFPEPKKELVGWKFALFIIPALVAGISGIAVVLAVGLLSLVLAAAVGALTVWAVSAALNSGFDLFSDMLVVIGASIILAAVGLLFLWTAVWLFSGAIPGIIRGIISLGEKWCCREVEE